MQDKAKSLVVLLWMVSLLNVNAETLWIGGKLVRKEIHCDGFPVDINCPRNDVIKILAAKYGRQERNHCGGYRGSDRKICDLPNAKNIVSGRCNNQTECNFDITRDVFNDPCPGVTKYLEVTYECVKFMFKCPGVPLRIGNPWFHKADIIPQNGWWTRDPLTFTERVFFSSFGEVLNEYASLDDFIEGHPMMTYDLPYKVSPGSIVVYDRNVFYVKDKSRNIVRYSLLTRSRTKEYTLPSGSSNRGVNKITLHVDDKGLWAVYDNDDGNIAVSRLDDNMLVPKKSWVTNLQQRKSLHTFIVCGILYSVSSASGQVDYSFNTNVKENQEDFRCHIPFDRNEFHLFPSTPSQRRRSFLNFNSTALSYNPRDRLLYMWDAKNGKTVNFDLHFKINPPTTTAPSGEDTTTKGETTTDSTILIPEEEYPYVCASIVRKALVWPAKEVGHTARLQCLDGTEGVATWRCVHGGRNGPARWEDNGPDFSKCIDWLNIIAAKHARRETDLAFAMESVSNGLARRQSHATEKWLRAISNFIQKSLQKANDQDKDSTKRILKAVVKTVNILTKIDRIWELLDYESRSKIANDLMESIEKGGFMYIRASAAVASQFQDSDIFQVTEDGVVVHAEVRERYLFSEITNQDTVFPSEDICEESGISDCGSDVITVPNGVIMVQRGQDAFGVVFMLFQTLPDQLPSEKPGLLDSSIISAMTPYYYTRSDWEERRKRLYVTFKHKSDLKNVRRCVKWSYGKGSSSGNWTEDGCNVSSSNRTHTTCECEGLGKFALTLSNVPAKASLYSYEVSLEIITSAGSTVAIICLLGCFLSLFLFKGLTSDRFIMLKNISACTLAAEVIFLVGINQTSNPIGCAVVAALLQYTLLAVFTWIVLEAVQLYQTLHDVFDEDSKWKFYYVAGYGIPAAVMSVSVGVGYSYYGTSENCFIDASSPVILVPMISTLTLVVAAVAVLCAVIYKISTESVTFADPRKTSKIRSSARKSFVVLFFQLLTWIVAVSWINERTTVLASLFCLSNFFLGICIFVCYCVLSRQIRKEYKEIFERIHCCGERSKKSYVENSLTFQRRYSPAIHSSSDRHRDQSSEYFAWNFGSPDTALASPLDDRTRVYGTRDRPDRSNRSRSNDTYRRQKMDPLIDEGITQQTTLIPTDYCPTIRGLDIISHNEIQGSHCHRHSDYFPRDIEIDPCIQQQKYRTGLPAAPRLRSQQKANTMAAQGYPNARFIPKTRSKSHLETISSQPTNSNVDGAKFWSPEQPSRNHMRDPKYPTMLRMQDDPTMHDLPPNSMIQRLRSEMLPRYENRQFQPIRDCSDSVIHPPSPVKIDNLSNSNRRSKRPLNKENNTSEDEGKGSSVEESEHNSHMYSHSDIAATRYATYGDASLSPPRKDYTRKFLRLNRQPSLHSDSDDPIATDCSAESRSPSFINQQRPQRVKHEMLV